MSAEQKALDHCVENDHKRTLAVLVPVMQTWLPVKLAVSKVLEKQKDGMAKATLRFWSR